MKQLNYIVDSRHFSSISTTEIRYYQLLRFILSETGLKSKQNRPKGHKVNLGSFMKLKHLPEINVLINGNDKSNI